MKKVHISYAGCPPEFPKKIKLAADLLSSQGYLATTGLWNGADSQLLLADEMDPFGSKVARLARLWEVPVLNVNVPLVGGSRSVSSAAPVHIIYKAIYQAIGKLEETAVQGEAPELLTLLNLSDDRVGMFLGGFPLAELNYITGLCHSRGASKLLQAKQALSADKALSFSPIDHSSIQGEGVQLSIENFLFDALLDDCVPSYKQDSALRLNTWPDIRSERFGFEVAQLSAQLINRPTTIHMLQSTYPSTFLNAYFWAVHGARLVKVSSGKVQESAYEPTESGKVKQALAKFVHWLGGK